MGKSTGDTVGGGGIGGLIGFAVGGPLGALAGAALGGLIGGTNIVKGTAAVLEAGYSDMANRSGYSSDKRERAREAASTIRSFREGLDD